MVFSTAILSISDTASQSPEADRSGPLLVEALESSNTFRVTRNQIVADDPVAIRQIVQQWIDMDQIELVITTGGTGLGLRDQTPEALETLFTRKTPAISHALIAHSLTKTPLAALSRLVSGTRVRPNNNDNKESLIVALPGSPKAVNECLQVLLGYQNKQGILVHALQLLGGDSGEQTHRLLQGSQHRSSTDTGHSHHHGSCGGGHLHSHKTPVPRTLQKPPSSYHTQDPLQGPSLRHRTSPYPLVSLDEALGLIAKHTPSPHPFDVITLPVTSKLIGHVLAQDVVATHDLPPGPTTNVDGYAVNAANTPPGDYRVVTLKTLSSRPNSTLVEPGEIFRINTGQGLPPGTDAVVMVEDTQLIETDDTKTPVEEKVVRILAQVDVGEHVRSKASDVEKGTVILTKGTPLSQLGGEIGTLAFLGKQEVLVYRKPKIALLSTGNELVDILKSKSSDSEPWGFNVFDSNRPGLQAAIEGLGYECIDLGIVSDDLSETESIVKKGLESADILITTGGTSMGESDLLKPLIERLLEGQIHFGRVCMKPGKPTTFATIPNPSSSKSSDKRIILFGLPGNPASALVCFHIFVLPSLFKQSGYPPASSSLTNNLLSKQNQWSSCKIKVTLSESIQLDLVRPEFHRVNVKVIQNGTFLAKSTGIQRSSGMHSMSSSNALLCLPSSKTSNNQTRLEKGEIVEAILLSCIF